MKIEASNPSQGQLGPQAGVCPHCKKHVTFTPIRVNNMSDLVLENGETWLSHTVCPNPECKGYVLVITRNAQIVETFPSLSSFDERAELPKEVVSPYREDYEEAVRVLDISPKASAALSRRLLQRIIREKAGITKRDLFQEIDELIETAGLSTRLKESVDAIRNIGNFAAHPLKYTHTGEIVDVEPGEAEWNLDVLEDLMDFFFVQAEKLKRRKEALNQKLHDAGKNPMNEG